MRRKPSNTRTWGWARLEVLTAAAGAVVLLVVGIYALMEAGMRLFGGSKAEIDDIGLLLFVGILGLAANIISIFILASQREDNMNMKAAFLEVMNDALGSVAVVASALLIISAGWNGFDAVAGAVIALMMIPRAIKLLHNAVKVLLEETPDGLDLDKVREHLEDVPHVLAVHDLHASTVSTGMPILMAHVVVDKDLPNCRIACASTSRSRSPTPPSSSSPRAIAPPPPTNSTNKKCSQREHSAGYKKSLYVCDFRAAQGEGLQR